MFVRNATADDLEAIVALSAFVARQHADAWPAIFKAPSDSQQTRKAFRDLLMDATSLHLVAAETQPVGHLWAQVQDRPETWTLFAQRLLLIHHIVVAPQYRRKGVGSLLLNSALEHARQQGITRVELNVWSFNSDARRFYAKHGFKVLSEKLAFTTDAAEHQRSQRV